MPAQNAIILRLQNKRGWRMSYDEQESENNARNEAPQASSSQAQQDRLVPPVKIKEIGGPKGPEPTRFGDWEKNGRCIDF